MRSLTLAVASFCLFAPSPIRAAEPADNSPPPVPLGRLPDAVTPSAYRLDLTVDPAKPHFTGHVEIDAALLESSRFIYLDGRDLAMQTVSASARGRLYAGQWRQVDPSGVALLSFDERLPAGPVTFRFDYSADFRDGAAGMFHLKVDDRWYSWTQFESIDARDAFPGFDQPGYKQPFTVTLRTPPGLTAVSNAPENGITHEGGMDVHHFAPTLPLPTYLLAMMVGPFAAAQGSLPSTPERSAPRPLRVVSTQPNAARLGFALTNTPRIVVRLESWFGSGFPFPKLDEIAAPIMPGSAMENPGADLFEDGLLMLDDTASIAQKRDFGMDVSHELSHQWFGDMVTPEWWDDTWLNESFANWMGYRNGQEWRPDLDIAPGALAAAFAAMDTDALLAGRPIHQRITRNAQIDAVFDDITYGKGGQVVGMFAGLIGDTRFRDGIRAYLAAHRYGNVSSAQFFQAMAGFAGDPRIVPAMQGFIDQQGVPLLTFDGADGRYRVTQSRYARLGTSAPDTSWAVPMCLRWGASRRCVLLDQPTASISLNEDHKDARLLMPNAGGIGYYRFELPRADWDRLIAVSASLPCGEALALADSLRASFMAGRAHASQLADLARVMVANPDSYASEAAFEGLDSLYGWGLLNAPAIAAYRRLVSRIFQPQLAIFGFDPRVGAYAGENPERSLHREQMIAKLAGTLRDPAIARQLADATKSLMGGNAAALDPVWYGEGFRIFLESSGSDGAKALLAKALASQDAVLRSAALHALAHSGSAEIANGLLTGINDPRLRVSERVQIVTGITVTDATRDLGYGYMRDHLDRLHSGGSGIFFAPRLPLYLGGYCSVERAAAIMRDFGPRLAGTSAQLDLERTVEQVRDCGLLKQARKAQASAEIANLQ